MNPMKSKKISIILSAYNEETLIKETIRKLTVYMNDNFNNWEMILVNDGSTDNTLKIIEESIIGQENIKVISHKRNFGQGRGFRTGFAVAEGDILVTFDADLSYEPQYIRKLVDEIEKTDADIVIVSPFLQGAKIINVPLLRRIFTVCANKFLSMTSSLDLSAITCAVRAYKAKTVKMLPLNSEGEEINLEIILKAQMLNLHVTEIPATLKWNPQKELKKKRKRTLNMVLIKRIFKYLFFGLLFNPSILFLTPLCVTLPVFLIYFFSLLKILIVQIKFYSIEFSEPFLEATSNALRWTFANYTHAFYFLILFLGISFFFFIAWFISQQNKFYFEQNYSFLSSLISAQGNTIEKKRPSEKRNKV